MRTVKIAGRLQKITDTNPFSKMKSEPRPFWLLVLGKYFAITQGGRLGVQNPSTTEWYVRFFMFGFRREPDKKCLGQQGKAVLRMRIHFLATIRFDQWYNRIFLCSESKTSHANEQCHFQCASYVALRSPGEMVGKSCFYQTNLDRKKNAAKEIGLTYIVSKHKCTIRLVTNLRNVHAWFSASATKTNDVISDMGVKITML